MLDIQNDHLQLTINPQLGGRIISMRSVIYECDILHPITTHSTATVGVDKPHVRYGSYPLAPYSNRIENATFDWQGRTYTLPVSPISPPHAIHGVSYYQPWQVEHHDASKVILIQHHQGDETWPFDYTLRQIFELRDNQCINTLALSNTDTNHQPVALGFHPYFTTKNLQTLQFSATDMWTLEDGIARTPKPIPPHQDFNTARPFTQTIDDLYQGIDSPCTATYDTHTVTIDSNSPYAILFSKDVDTFFCFEPVQNVNNAHNMQSSTAIEKSQTYPLDYGLTALAPQDVVDFFMTIAVGAPSSMDTL